MRETKVCVCTDAILASLATPCAMMRNIGIWLVIGLAMMVLFNLLGPRSSGSRELPFSDFISKVESGSVLEVVMRGRQVEGLTDANERFQTQVPNYPALFEILEKNFIFE